MTQKGCIAKCHMKWAMVQSEEQSCSRLQEAVSVNKSLPGDAPLKASHSHFLA